MKKQTRISGIPLTQAVAFGVVTAAFSMAFTNCSAPTSALNTLSASSKAQERDIAFWQGLDVFIFKSRESDLFRCKQC